MKDIRTRYQESWRGIRYIPPKRQMTCNILTNNSVELSATGSPTVQQPLDSFPRIVWNPNVYDLVHKSIPLVPILSHTNPVTPPNPISSRSTLIILYTHQRSDRSSGLFAYGFPTYNLHAVLFSFIRAACPSHFILLDLVILIVL
jgi:hypothetical protein